MVRTFSTMMELGTQVPDFILPDASQRLYQFSALRQQYPKGTLVVFICNHCPFVLHVIKPLAALCQQMQDSGLAVLAINSNDVEAYPEDRPEKMKEFASRYAFTFPYLFDENQEIARSFQAACTPDFYLFDRDGKLVYRGQMDESRPGNGRPVDGVDLREAVEHLLDGKAPMEQQQPSIGCNIKWKPGNEPSWFLSG